ncbi:polyprotein [Phytophthora megakarya]|uniref:Polyprotein n=1 Tax=Phytophthora megakarya TaxID=4795 RepID=A0A225UK70_9STRA|nr:polyprotein [Phytophthora megakarya]
MASFHTGDRVLLSTEGIRTSAVTNLGAIKLAPPFIGLFIGDAYTLDIPSSLRLHPTFYAGRLKRYYPAEIQTPRTRPLARASRSLITSQYTRLQGAQPRQQLTIRLSKLFRRPFSVPCNILRPLSPKLSVQGSVHSDVHVILRSQTNGTANPMVSIIVFLVTIPPPARCRRRDDTGDSSGRPEVNENGIVNGVESENANANGNPSHVPALKDDTPSRRSMVRRAAIRRLLDVEECTVVLCDPVGLCDIERTLGDFTLPLLLRRTI